MQTPGKLLEGFEEFASRHLPESHNPVYDPFRYVMGLQGKKIRPLLVLISSQLFEGDLQKAFPLALAIEVFHNFTLVHDDIMDEASTRRGKPSVHVKFSQNDAILSGDIMLLYSFKYMDTPDDALNRRMRSTFTDTAIAICEGQKWDMDFEQRLDVTVDEYLGMIRLKTAVLLGLALEIGAMNGGADDPTVAILREIGVQSGIAFQVKDDILDLYGTEAEVGKKRGGDVMQNKKTVLFTLASESLKGDDLQELRDLFSDRGGDPEEKLEQVEELFLKANVQQRAEDLASSYRKKADMLINELKIPEAGRTYLGNFFEALFNRSF